MRAYIRLHLKIWREIFSGSNELNSHLSCVCDSSYELLSKQLLAASTLILTDEKN